MPILFAEKKEYRYRKLLFEILTFSTVTSKHTQSDVIYERDLTIAEHRYNKKKACKRLIFMISGFSDVYKRIFFRLLQ